MPPVVVTDAPETMWQHFLQSWPIFATVSGFLLGLLAVLARWIFGHIVSELQANTEELKLTRKEMAGLRERMSRLEGFLSAPRQD